MSVPTVTTQSPTSLENGTVTANGTVTSDGGATVTVRGACWALTTNPVAGGLHAEAALGGTGVFTAAVTGLSAGTLYYLRAYATNADGTGYGANVTFYTAPAAASSENTVDIPARTRSVHVPVH